MSAYFRFGRGLLFKPVLRNKAGIRQKFQLLAGIFSSLWRQSTHLRRY